MTIENFVNKTQTQNQEIQVFIIKQFERGDKEDFENKYSKYINGNNIFLQSNISDALDSLISSSGRQNYLIPLIYDTPEKSKIKLEEVKINQDLYYYTDKYVENISNIQMINIDNGNKKYYKYKINNFYYFNKYSFLLECPLLDYTKLSYVYQIKHNNILGIGNVTAVNTSFNVNSSSNCTIDFICGDNDEINKEMFDTNDIVIIKMLKNNNDINKIKNNYNHYNIYEQEFNLYKNIFTGYIDNVNYTIDWSNKNKTLNLICSGPSKKMLYTRIISGQATANTKDWTSALIPLSVYSFPQIEGKDKKYPIDNETIIKNIIIRTFCNIDNIPEIKENKLNVEYYFNKNAIAISSYDQKFYQDSYEYKMKYHKAVSENMKNFYETVYDDDGNKLYIKINNNQIKLTSQKNTISLMQLPIMLINGTNQPAYQYNFNDFNNIFTSQYMTLFQFIQKIATTLDFCLYDDPDGIIHFEIYDTSLIHLYDLNNANNLTNIISFSENQNTNEMMNIIQASSCGTLTTMKDTAEYGIFTLIRDKNSIKQLGERYLNLGSIVGLQNTITNIEKEKLTDVEISNKIYMQPLTTYSRCIMQKINSKAMSQITVRLLGNPLIMMGKYAYIKDIEKLFYINSIRQSWAANSFYTIDLGGIYTRNKICNLDEITNSVYNIKGITIPNSRKNSNIAKFKYVQQKINNELQKAYDNNNVIKELEKLFYNNNLYYKLREYLKTKFNYDDENYLKLIYDNKNYIFTYLDGYFWEIPIQNDAFKLALQKQKQLKDKLL